MLTSRFSLAAFPGGSLILRDSFLLSLLTKLLAIHVGGDAGSGFSMSLWFWLMWPIASPLVSRNLRLTPLAPGIELMV